MIDSAEAARQLGIKLSTLYSYVSRGLIASYPTPGSHRRLLISSDVARLGRGVRVSKEADDSSIHISSTITHLTAAGPEYRGRPATELATTTTFEKVAAILWQCKSVTPWRGIHLEPIPTLLVSDLLKWVVLMSGARPHLSSDLRPNSIVRIARQLLATMTDSLPTLTDSAPPVLSIDDIEYTESIAARLAIRLTPQQPSQELVRAVNAALVLLADHELTSPTLAVRVAASARANLYDSLLTGVSVASVAARGPASELAYSLFREAEIHGVERAMDYSLQQHGFLPGFGPEEDSPEDPRFTTLQKLIDEWTDVDRLEIVRSVIKMGAAHELPHPNIDLALAALMFVADMPRDSASIISTIARTAGYVAHYLEELNESVQRFRPPSKWGPAPRN